LASRDCIVPSWKRKKKKKEWKFGFLCSGHSLGMMADLQVLLEYAESEQFDEKQTEREINNGRLTGAIFISLVDEAWEDKAPQVCMARGNAWMLLSLPLLLQNSLNSCIQNRDDIISASP
jgi:hypothetical protein